VKFGAGFCNICLFIATDSKESNNIDGRIRA